MKCHMDAVTGLLLLIFMPCAGRLQAQTPESQTDSTVIAPAQSAVSEQDSTARAARARLLPANISFGERLMWGDEGMMRRIGIVPALSPQERKFELSLRRTMLTTHQIDGFVTLGLMGATAYYGQQVLNGRRSMLSNHKTFLTATIIGYSTTALLAVLAPPPIIRRDETSTITLHKTLAWVHFGGMILTPILGGLIHHRRGTSYGSTAQFHQIAGYATTATFAASLIVITF
jgi:hypothetical protein